MLADYRARQSFHTGGRVIIHSHSIEKYPPSSYDGNLCLKPSLLLWAAVLYLTRAFTLPMATAIGAFAGVNPDAIALLHRYWDVDSLIPATLAITILYAFCRRVPSAGNVVRWVWARGRLTLSASALLDLALSGIAAFHHENTADQFVYSLLSASVDVYFLMYLIAARRVRDTFADFPTR